MSHPANDHFYETALEALEEHALILLSKSTLERLQDDLWTLNGDEAMQVDEALKAMKINEAYEPLKSAYPKSGELKMVD